jgi:hypothetical protein
MESKSINLFAALIFMALATAGTMSQGDFKKPEPLNNETVNMLLGKWTADPYEVLGSKRSETANYYLDINGQFLVIEIDGKDETGYTYKSKVILQIAKDGSFTGWSFDDWGKVGNYTGTAIGNKITVTGKKENSTDNREFEINGNTMTLKLAVNMKWLDGQEKTINQTITYHKQ